jgi:hypothetical protein
VVPIYSLLVSLYHHQIGAEAESVEAKMLYWCEVNPMQSMFLHKLTCYSFPANTGITTENQFLDSLKAIPLNYIQMFPHRQIFCLSNPF